MDIVDVPPYCVGEEQKKWTLCERRFSQSLQHLPLTPRVSADSVRSSMTLVFEDPLDLDPVSVLYAANEMFKNLFDMATDSFGLKSGGILPVDSSRTQTGRNGIGVPYIYHGGAVTAAVDLLPAVSKMNGTATSEVRVDSVDELSLDFQNLMDFHCQLPYKSCNFCNFHFKIAINGFLKLVQHLKIKHTDLRQQSRKMHQQSTKNILHKFL